MLQHPPRPIPWPDELLRHANVGHLTGRRVRLKHPPKPHGETTEQYHRSKPTGVPVERRTRGRATLTRSDPLGVHARGARVFLRRWMRHELGLFRGVEDLGIVAVRPSDEFAVRPDPKLSPP